MGRALNIPDGVKTNFQNSFLSPFSATFRILLLGCRAQRSKSRSLWPPIRHLAIIYPVRVRDDPAGSRWRNLGEPYDRGDALSIMS